MLVLLASTAAFRPPATAGAGPSARPAVASRRASAPLATGAAAAADTDRPRFPSSDLPLGLGQLGVPEPGPMPLVGERDACGVGEGEAGGDPGTVEFGVAQPHPDLWRKHALLASGALVLPPCESGAPA